MHHVVCLLIAKLSTQHDFGSLVINVIKISLFNSFRNVNKSQEEDLTLSLYKPLLVRLHFYSVSPFPCLTIQYLSFKWVLPDLSTLNKNKRSCVKVSVFSYVKFILQVGSLKVSVCFGVFFQRLIRDLVESGRYDTHSNFTVVLQPFLRDIVVPLLVRNTHTYMRTHTLHINIKH